MHHNDEDEALVVLVSAAPFALACIEHLNSPALVCCVSNAGGRDMGEQLMPVLEARVLETRLADGHIAPVRVHISEGDPVKPIWRRVTHGNAPRVHLAWHLADKGGERWIDQVASRQKLRRVLSLSHSRFASPRAPHAPLSP